MLPVAILAGGLATRLRPVTETVPKALVEVKGEPFLAHQLRLLRRHGIERVVLCVGYLGEKIQEFAGDGRAFGLHVEYAFDGRNCSARRARCGGRCRCWATRSSCSTAIPICPATTAPRWRRSAIPAKLGLMTVYRNEGHWDTSNVEFAGGRILAYDKANRTPAMRYIDYGLGVFQRAAFEDVPADRPSDLAVVYQGLLRRGELAAWESPERFYEIGSLEGIDDLGEFLKS